MLSYNLIAQKRKPMTLQSMSAKDKFIFNQMVDWLAGKPDFFINYKEFISWYFLDVVFGALKNTGQAKTTGIDRLVVGFKNLGMRLSQYCLVQSVKRFDT